MQKVKNLERFHKVPDELKKLPRWVVIRKEIIDGEEIIIPCDPATGESLKGNGEDHLQKFEDAISLIDKNHDKSLSLGFVQPKVNPYHYIYIQNALNSNGGGTELAFETVDKLIGYMYAEVDGQSLRIIVKGPISKDRLFKNINVTFFAENKIIPITGKTRYKPKNLWERAKKLDVILEYYNKKNSQVDEKSVQLPPWYERAKTRLKFFPNLLAMHFLGQRDWRICNDEFYVREVGEWTYKKITVDEIKKEIMEYLSPKYLTDQDISNTFTLFKKQVQRDDEMIHPNRMEGKTNFRNGVFETDSGVFVKYPHDYHTAIRLNVNFNKDAKCPRFEEFLRSALEDEDDISTVQEMLGYLLTSEMKAEKAFILYGTGRTGKSTLISVIEDIIGREHVSNIPFQQVGDKFKTSLLQGKLLNTFSDLPQRKIQDTGFFKALISGDNVVGENKGETPFMFANTARMLFSTNSLPSNFVDQSSGFYRRLLIIHFNQPVSEENTNRNLKKELLEEKEGIVQWALQGLSRLIKNNYSFTISSKSKKLMREYEKTNNNVIWFVDEYCNLGTGLWEAGKDLYDLYKEKCTKSQQAAISQREFYNQIEAQFSKDGVSRFRDSQTRSISLSGIKIRRNR